ncbi:MAG: SPL family radical SAM protein [Planctomycetota bacterium]|jgi:DNA repair photolyase
METYKLFGSTLRDYKPRKSAWFNPRTIVLARNSDKPEYRDLVASICKLYPLARVILNYHKPHNRIGLGTADPYETHRRGKSTLVLAEHHSALRFSAEEGNTCPNYWHFSPYGFCPFDCSYCYLAGTPGVRFSPTVKIFLNLDQILDSIDKAARQITEPTAFYLGKLQDALALDSITGYSRSLVPFFAEHPYARMTLLTKSDDIENLIDLDHRRHTILSWTLNPPEIVDEYERHTPPVDARIEAMRKCAEVGYPIRAIVMPVIPVEGWQELYVAFLSKLLKMVPLERITLGGICSYSFAQSLMENKIGKDNPITRAMCVNPGKSVDGRSRYPMSLRIKIYQNLISYVRDHNPELPIGLCLEEPQILRAAGLTDSVGRCNCVL